MNLMKVGRRAFNLVSDINWDCQEFATYLAAYLSQKFWIYAFEAG